MSAASVTFCCPRRRHDLPSVCIFVVCRLPTLQAIWWTLPKADLASSVRPTHLWLAVCLSMTKKRKAELDLDVERNLHSSFVTAANSISHLFTQAIQQNKKAQVAGAQQALVSCYPFVTQQSSYLPCLPPTAVPAHGSDVATVTEVTLHPVLIAVLLLLWQERQIAWVLKEYGNAQYVPISALLGHLQQEIQVRSLSLSQFSSCRHCGLPPMCVAVCSMWMP